MLWTEAHGWRHRTSISTANSFLQFVFHGYVRLCGDNWAHGNSLDDLGSDVPRGMRSSDWHVASALAPDSRCPEQPPPAATRSKLDSRTFEAMEYGRFGAWLGGTGETHLNDDLCVLVLLVSPGSQAESQALAARNTSMVERSLNSCRFAPLQGIYGRATAGRATLGSVLELLTGYGPRHA